MALLRESASVVGPRYAPVDQALAAGPTHDRERVGSLRLKLRGCSRGRLSELADLRTDSRISAINRLALQDGASARRCTADQASRASRVALARKSGFGQNGSRTSRCLQLSAISRQPRAFCHAIARRDSVIADQ